MFYDFRSLFTPIVLASSDQKWTFFCTKYKEHDKGPDLATDWFPQATQAQGHRIS